MKVLLDNSVWIGYFKRRDEYLIALPDRLAVINAIW